MKNYKSFKDMQREYKNPSAPDIPAKISDWKAEQYVKEAEELAKKLGRSKLDTQLRRVFDTLRKKQLEFKKGQFSKDEVIILKPRLAYAIARKEELAPIFDKLNPLLDKVSSKEDFDKVVKFMEAVIAYYKYQQAMKGKGGKR